MVVTASTVEDHGDLLSPTEIEDIVDTSTTATNSKKKKKKKKKNHNNNNNDKQEVEVETAVETAGVEVVEEEEETVALVVEEEEEEKEEETVALVVEEEEKEEEETVAIVVEEEKEEKEEEQQQFQQQQEEISAVVVRKEAQKPWSPAVSLLEHGASVGGEEMDGSSVETENKRGVVAKVKKPSTHAVVSSVMDSRKAWGGQVLQKTDGPRIDSVIPYETLKSMRDGIDMTRKEEYLAADEFQAHFKQDIESFKKLPLWRQILLKKKVGLF